MGGKRGLFTASLVFLITCLLLHGAVNAQGKQSFPVSHTTKNFSNDRSSSLLFVPNVGQFKDEVRFKTWGGSSTVFLTDDALWFVTLEPTSAKGRNHAEGDRASHEGLPDEEPYQGVALKVTFPGANPHPRLKPFGRLDTRVNYFLGNDPARWRTNVPVYTGVRYVDLYPGVDLEVTGEGGRWAWRLVCRANCPFALRDVRLRVEGVEGITVEDGALRLSTAVGEFTLPLLQAVSADSAPIDFGATSPQVNGSEISAPFVSGGLVLGSPAMITPQDNSNALVYSTYLGGSGDEYGSDIRVDSDGNMYVAGYTYSSDFPTSAGAFDTVFSGSQDAFVVKLNAAGSGLVYATFIGGSGAEYAFSMALDTSGQVYVTGWTDSADFPTTPGAFDTSYNGGGRDVFVTKLNAAGTALVYSTYIGGSGWDWGNNLVVNDSGEAYVVGTSIGSGFPTTPGAYQTGTRGGWDAFVLKLTSAGDALIYSTFVGGGCDDYGGVIAVDGDGAAYISGWTCSSDFPVTPGAFDTTYNGGGYGSGGDPFVAKVNATGTALVYSTYLGGSGFDDSYAITVDGDGAVYITGNTGSYDFPTTSGAFDTAFNGGNADGFVAKLNSSGSDLLFGSFLGGSANETIWGITRDGDGSIYLYGETNSTDFPTTSNAYDTTYNGGTCGDHACYDLFIAVLNSSASDLTYGTYIDGSSDDSAWCEGMWLKERQVYFSAHTKSTDFPVTSGAHDTSHNGGLDLIVAKFSTFRSCSEWNLASDFRVSPYQENPNRDSCGNMNVWYFMQSAGLDRDPQTYSLLPNFTASAFQIPGLQQWHGTEGSPQVNDLNPAIGINATGETQYPLTLTWPPNAMRVHPTNSKLVIIGWRSPISGYVEITGAFSDMDSSCGDGILWYIDKGTTNLAEGSIANGGEQHFDFDGVAVDQGDFVYFVVHPNSGWWCDSTRVDITISSTSCIPGPLDLMLVIDRSGSMDGQPLADAKSAAKTFVGYMDLSTDQVGLVSFASDATLDHHLSQDRASVDAAIDALSAGGSTAIGDALYMAHQELVGPYHNSSAHSVIVLLSDGKNNRGRDPIQEADAAKSDGIRIITIGLGSDIDENELRSIASSPDDYYYAPDSAGLQAIYDSIAESICRPPGGHTGPVFLPLVVKNFVLRGAVEGQVVSAVTGQAIEGATVCVVSTGQCDTTDSNGHYFIADVPVGSQTLRASATGYIPLDQVVTVMADRTAILNFALSPSQAQGEMRIVLTWGETPRDLDSHLWLPSGHPFHVYYAEKGDCDNFPYACLDVDDLTSYGPETITIKRWYSGRYVYAVYQYSSDGALTTSGAKVQVYVGNQLVREYDIPTTGDGRWWYVFDVDGDTGSIITRNYITSGSPGPYGSWVVEGMKEGQ